MKDLVSIAIDAPLDIAARLFADPALAPLWMKEMAYKPLAGEPGAPGSTYRLESTSGGMSFTVTVVARHHLHLEAPNVAVEVEARFTALSPRKTLLVSEETFRFKGLLARLFGGLAKHSIHRAHSDQMERFKAFAEARWRAS